MIIMCISDGVNTRGGRHIGAYSALKDSLINKVCKYSDKQDVAAVIVFCQTSYLSSSQNVDVMKKR